MPIPNYADAVRFVRRQPRINASTLADGLGIRWSLAEHWVIDGFLFTRYVKDELLA